jgi:hypothetical protein
MSKDMDIDKVIKEFKDFNPTEEQKDKFEELVDSYSDKSEDEIFFEIIKVNEKIENEMSAEEYEELFEKLESIRPLLNEEQLKKLDKVLYILKK